jgi:hypothetical protein
MAIQIISTHDDGRFATATAMNTDTGKTSTRNVLHNGNNPGKAAAEAASKAANDVR